MSILSASGNEYELPVREKKMGNDNYPVFVFDASDYSVLNYSKLRLERIYPNGTRDIVFCFFLNYDQDRGRSTSYVGDLRISNK